MASLEVEHYDTGVRRWVKPPEVKAGDPPGSISDNKPDGKRNIYLFECAPDDSKSTIYRSGFGADIELAGGAREVFSDPSRLEVVKEIGKGESFEIMATTDRSRQPRRIRFTHK